MCRLAKVEIQLIMHGLDILDLLRFARCNKFTRHAASHSFAWKKSLELQVTETVTKRLIVKLQSIITESLLPIPLHFTPLKLQMSHVTVNFSDFSDYNNDLKTLAKILKLNIPHVTSVNFNHSCLNVERIGILVDAISHNKNITSVTFSQTYFGNVGTLPLAEAIKNNGNLISLSLMTCGFRSQGIVCLAEAIKCNKNLTYLNFSNNNLYDESVAVIIIDAIKDSNITSLNVGNNSITEKGLYTLSQFISLGNNKLSTLILCGNNFGDKGFIYLSDALKNNKTITSIDISNCNHQESNFDGTGILAIAEFIKHNNSLITLDLSCNDINDEGASALADAIKINKRLAYLNLDNNSIEDIGAIKLGHAISQNTSLVQTRLAQNLTTLAGHIIFNDIFSRNGCKKIVDTQYNIILNS